MKYDVVIIGTGLGGLECGCILSQRGLSVLLLEKHHQPGGCIQSYKRNGVNYDTGLHYIGGLQEGHCLYNTFRELGITDLPWQRLDSAAYDKITIANDTFDFAEGFDEFYRVMCDRFPNEKEGLRKYMQLLYKAEEEQLLPITHNVNPSLNEFLLTTNAYQWLKETFHDELLINVLSGSSLRMELRKDTLPLFTFIHGNSCYMQGSWRLKGPGNILVNHLVQKIKDNGGDVVCSSEVTELHERDRRIYAATCADGTTYEGGYFISDIHPALTCGLIKNSQVIRNVYRRRMNSLENTFGFFTASINLKPGSIPYFNHNKYVYPSPCCWDIADGGGTRGILVSHPVCEDAIDILTPMPWSECSEWQTSSLGHRDAGYEEYKHRKAQECIALAERVLPQLSGCIEGIHTSTPLSYRDYTGTPQGSAYGIRKDYSMPMLTMLAPQTPIANLFMTGQNLQMHGIHGVTVTSLFTCAEIIGKGDGLICKQPNN